MFMNQIGLQLENSVQNIIVKELYWEGCLSDRERRKIFDVCFEKLTDNLDPLTKQKWLRTLTDESLNGGLKLDDLNLSLKEVIINHCLIDRDTLLNTMGRRSCLNRSGVNSKDNINKTELRLRDNVSPQQLVNGLPLINLLRMVKMDTKPPLNQFDDIVSQNSSAGMFSWPEENSTEIVSRSIREHFKGLCCLGMCFFEH